MAWIRLDDHILVDDWLNSLTEAQRYSWIAFCSYAGGRSPKWRVRVVSLTSLCRILNVSTDNLKAVLDSAKSLGKVEEENGDWVIVNGPKYDYDPTRAERQKAYRKRKQEDTKEESNESNSYSRYTTKVTLHNNTIQDNTIQETPTESHTAPSAVTDPDCLAVIKTWNEEKAEAWPRVLKPKPNLCRKIRESLNEPEFSVSEIITRAKGSDFLRGKRFVDLFWIVKTSEKTGNLNWWDILHGRYDNDRSGGAEPEIRKRAAHLTSSGSDW